jgi:hypothetical protein
MGKGDGVALFYLMLHKTFYSILTMCEVNSTLNPKSLYCKIRELVQLNKQNIATQAKKVEQ